MKVLLPAPGTPVIPMRMVRFPLECSWQRRIICCATALCSGRRLSTRVMAWLSMVVLPAKIPSMYSSAVSMEGRFL